MHLSEYLDYHDEYQPIGRFLDDVYVHKRIHFSLGYLIPAESEAQWQEEHTLVLDLELTTASEVSSSWGSLQKRHYQDEEGEITPHGIERAERLLAEMYYARRE